MDLVIITIVILWVLIETIMFCLKSDNESKMDTKNSSLLYAELTNDNNECTKFPCSDAYECDSGINSTSTEESETSSAFMQFSRKKFNKERIAEIEKLKKRAMAKQLACLERDQKKIEQYLKTKVPSNSKADALDMLCSFLQHIRKHKIISIESMASEFKLRPQEVVEHIKELQLIGILVGVFDDRGKFIYVPERESKAIGRFIQQQHLFHWPQKAFV